MTNNLYNFNIGKYDIGAIKIGNVHINNISKESINYYIFSYEEIYLSYYAGKLLFLRDDIGKFKMEKLLL